MKKKILLSLLILCNLVKANTSVAEEAPKDALEDAIDHLDIKTVKDILSKEQISANRKAMLIKYCKNITALYRRKTTSIFDSARDRLSIYWGISGWFVVISLLSGSLWNKIFNNGDSDNTNGLSGGGLINIKKGLKTRENGLIALSLPIAGLLGYLSTISIIKGVKLDHAFSNLKKARRMEYLVNGIDL